MQLLFQAWPPESAEKYARAYAEHGHESRLVPPPPEGCTVPASFAHAFETAETAERRNAEERALEREAGGGSNDREEPGSPDERPEESNPKGSVSNPEGSVSEPKGPGRVGSDAASDVSGGAEAETGSLAETTTPRGGDAVRRDAALVSASVRRFIADAREEEARREAFAGAREAMRAADEAMRARRERGTAAGLRSSADATNDEHRRRVEANDAKGEGEGEGEGANDGANAPSRLTGRRLRRPGLRSPPADDPRGRVPDEYSRVGPRRRVEGDVGARGSAGGSRRRAGLRVGGGVSKARARDGQGEGEGRAKRRGLLVVSIPVYRDSLTSLAWSFFPLLFSRLRQARRPPPSARVSFFGRGFCFRG